MSKSSGGVLITDQRVVHLGQGACISVHKAVLRPDVPCFQCTTPVEIEVSIYHCGTAPLDLESFIHCMLCYC